MLHACRTTHCTVGLARKTNGCPLAPQPGLLRVADALLPQVIITVLVNHFLPLTHTPNRLDRSTSSEPHPACFSGQNTLNLEPNEVCGDTLLLHEQCKIDPSLQYVQVICAQHVGAARKATAFRQQTTFN